MNTAILSDVQLPSDRPAPGLLGWAERGWVPDALVRHGIRRLCADRLRDERAGGPAAQARRYQHLMNELQDSPLAIHTDDANAQHYELPADFFKLCLGGRLKYSGCYYATGRETLDQAEAAMLELTGMRAELADGQRILELGCGWGSLTLWMADRYPNARITAVSNSASQRQHIQQQCQLRGLGNVEVITCDVNTLQLPPAEFDRCVSVEMFEHMRNYATLLARVAAWLAADGKVFIHIFSHRRFAYPYEVRGPSDWMAEHFFTGGTMPSDDLLYHFQDDVRIEGHWRVSGAHYEHTANAWLAKMDANRAAIDEVFARVYGPDAVTKWRARWRMFFMACAELFGYRGGTEWLVSQYRCAPAGRGARC